MECYPWAEYVDSADCLSAALLQNRWVTTAELSSMTEADMKTRLVAGLHLRLMGSSHTVNDLNSREISVSKGGLCGLAGLQQALGSSLVSSSQLRSLSYVDIRQRMEQEMMMGPSRMSDADLLSEFFSCRFLIH